MGLIQMGLIERQSASFARATSQIELSDSVFDTWQ